MRFPFAEYRRELDAWLSSTKPEDVMAKEADNAALRKLAVTPGAVHQNATLSNLSVQYANEEYIGTQLMPVIKVSKLSDIYYLYDRWARMAVPDDAMGARGSANEISELRSTATYSCKSYALKNHLDALTLANQDAPLNEMVDLTQSVADIMELAEEIRIATIMCTSGNFPTGNKATLTGSDRWDTLNGGNVVKNIQDAVAACWMGHGPSELVGYCSLAVWNVLSRNAGILDLFKYNGSSPGLATPDMLAGWFGLSKILVGKARKGTANEGQTQTSGRVWSDVFGVARVAKQPSIRNASFGATFQMGERRADQWFDIAIGTQGGYYSRVSANQDHKIIASDTGYLITSPIG